MSSRKPVNRKRRRTRPSTRRSYAPQSDSIESLREKEFQLNAQIGELEKVLAHHDESETQKNSMRRENILPPPSGNHPYPDLRSLSYAEKRKLNRERNKSGLYFLLLLAIAIGLAAWLLYSGG